MSRLDERADEGQIKTVKGDLLSRQSVRSKGLKEALFCLGGVVAEQLSELSGSILSEQLAPAIAGGL